MAEPEYLSIDQLARRVPYQPQTIRNLIDPRGASTRCPLSETQGPGHVQVVGGAGLARSEPDLLIRVTLYANIISTMVLLLKQWRERRGLSLRQLGEQSGVSYVTISNIETGKLDPRLSTLARLARALGISVRALFPVERRQHSRRG
jgi:DNA-binding XRE family transcriptional regulator